MKRLSYEEEQKVLAKLKYCYIITEYPGDGSGYEKDLLCAKEKVAREVLEKWFDETCKKIEWENTYEEERTCAPCITYVQLERCDIVYDNDREEYRIDFENGFGEMGKEVRGHHSAEEEEEEKKKELEELFELL